MEYLMTYGWAILIIAVVLGALFQLGVFNSSSFSPRAPPGACQVFRPSGPRTTANINLMGVCTGQLPQYTAQLNGQNGFVSVSASTTLDMPTNEFSVSAWINFPSATACVNIPSAPCTILGHGAMGSIGYRVMVNSVLKLEAAIVDINSNSVDLVDTGTLNPNTWNQVAVVVLRGTNRILFYVNGALSSNTDSSAVPGSLTNPAITLYLGSALGGTAGFRVFNGLLSNVQLYNASLTANQIQALYLEGIGGAPMKLQNLAGWWPLNGNANDYSGNGNNGVPSNVVFTSQYGK